MPPFEGLVMATWYAIYQTNDKKLVSIASVLPAVQDSKFTYEALLGKPDLNAVMWDEITASFISRPAKVLIDRFEEFKKHSTSKSDWDALSLASKNNFESVIVEMLGTKRYRNKASPFAIGG